VAVIAIPQPEVADDVGPAELRQAAILLVAGELPEPVKGAGAEADVVELVGEFEPEPAQARGSAPRLIEEALLAGEVVGADHHVGVEGGHVLLAPLARLRLRL